MKVALLYIFLMFFVSWGQAQVSSQYTVSFENAAHHEADIVARFTNLKADDVEITMSRSSPGRYALHEFVKNVYNVKVTNAKGEELKTTRPNPYSWLVEDHDGSIDVSYTLFANHGDGTYAQVDETHAHLNMPATFIYVPELSDEGMTVDFDLPKNSNWKIATQLKHLHDNLYLGDNLQYFMDSPIEIADFHNRSFNVKGQSIHLVLHDDAASEEQINSYFENIKKIVLQQEAVYSELPTFDYGEYTFLACYMPNATGDGMEHRNSTMIASTRSLAQDGAESNIGTFAHEFFHCWNVERIRPKDLEPFDFQKANMSSALWFAEGFTNYYDALTQCRTGIWSKEHYFQDMTRGFNYVWTSPARQFFNPIEMSYQAPFVDAAKSVDETNRENTFISYYSYGEMLGLALDLSLREKNLNLDDFMKLMWNNFAKKQVFYTVDDIHQTLNSYAGKEFGDDFFKQYIYKSEMPDFTRLFANVGVVLETKNDINFGAMVQNQQIVMNPLIGSSAYEAKLQKDDKILKIDTIDYSGNASINSILSTFKPGDTIKIIFERFGRHMETMLKIKTDTSYNVKMEEPKDLSKAIQKSQDSWLQPK